jgi:hypothetical protein
MRQSRARAHTARIVFRAEPELRAAIEHAADEERRPISSLIRHVLADWLAGRAADQQPRAAA